MEVTQVKERYKSPYNYPYPPAYPAPEYNPIQTRSYTQTKYINNDFSPARSQVLRETFAHNRGSPLRSNSP